LVTAPNIHCSDALEVDWERIIKPKECSYIIGNPPFVGKSMQSKKQTLQLKNLVQLANLRSGGGILDFVCSWFIKAGTKT